MLSVNNIVSETTVTERKSMCRSCPTKDFFRDLQTCLKVESTLEKHTRLKTSTCPMGHWKK